MTVIPFPDRGRDVDPAGKDNVRDDLMPGTDVEHAHLYHAQEADIEAVVPDREWKDDAANLGTNELRRKYPRTFASFTNMKARAREGAATVHPEFQKFRTFFRCMGPRRFAHLTIDRTDRANLEYGPGLCRWANKQEQAQNRRSTTFLTHPETRERKPLVRWAASMGVLPSRLRRQLRDGWSEEEIFAGQRTSKKERASPAVDRWPWKLEPEQLRAWERQYQQRRKRVTPTGFEFRYEFALRRLREQLHANAVWVTETFERWPGEDGPEDLPDKVREKWNAIHERTPVLEERLKEALAGEPDWRQAVSGQPRPYARPDDDE